jgi:putative PIN family toxin of toxin-antitoxin system
MSSNPRRAVFDCNTLLQAMAAPAGPAGECMARVLAGSVQLYVATAIIDELREVLQRPTVLRKLRLTPRRAERFLITLKAAATLIDEFEEPFRYSRDPDDSVYVNLAIACDAMLIVSRDKDLLDLMNDANVEGKQLRNLYPMFQVLTPPQFLATIRAE